MFLRHEGVEPTDNPGERSLRHLVIWRKHEFGTPSGTGSRLVETMLTGGETCRQQRCNVFWFLTAAIEARLTHQPVPLLLPRVWTVSALAVDFLTQSLGVWSESLLSRPPPRRGAIANKVANAAWTIVTAPIWAANVADRRCLRRQSRIYKEVLGASSALTNRIV